MIVDGSVTDTADTSIVMVLVVGVTVCEEAAFSNSGVPAPVTVAVTSEPVSNVKPVGAVRIIVPTVASPAAASVNTGPVNGVYVGPTVISVGVTAVIPTAALTGTAVTRLILSASIRAKKILKILLFNFYPPKNGFISLINLYLMTSPPLPIFVLAALSTL
ncbi:unnamed protein product [marine sediment metagenome]|uniref:Uncharacterized protein n=1 Tax=marine sediment metagenome TaxID=412755 RepID=X1Q8J1_9ZZZZ